MKNAMVCFCVILFLLTACTGAKNPEVLAEEPFGNETFQEPAETGEQDQIQPEESFDSPSVPPVLGGETAASFPQYDPIGAKDFILRLNQILYEKAYDLLETTDSQPTTYLCDYRTTYQSPPLTSFRYEYYYYQFPAAHGLSACSGVTIDWEREEILTLQSFFFEHPIWKEVVNDRMRAYLFQEEIALFDITAFEGVTEDQTFYLTDTAFVLVYPPYRYTPGVLGVLEIPVDYADVASHLREVYRDVLLPEPDTVNGETVNR